MSNTDKSALVPKRRFPEFRGAGGWNVKPFQKLFTIGSGRDYKHLSGGSIPVYGSGGYMLSVNDFLHDGESVCIGRKGTINNPMLLTGKFWTVDTLFYTHSFRDCLPKFVYAIFQNIDWLKHNEAGGVPSLSKTIIEKIQTAIPGIAEQQKIADCLSSLDELIAAQTCKVDALKTHKKGLMQQLFPREGETQPRMRFPEFRDAAEWLPKTLGDACKMQAGKFVSAADIHAQSASGFFPCFGGNGLRGFTVTQTHNGTYPLIGRQGALCGNVKLATGKFHATEHALVVTPNKGVEAVWLYYLLDLLNLNRFATGQAQPGLSVDVLEKVPAAVPEDEKEQQAISSCLTSLDTVIAAAIQELETLKTHKKGLMQQLFPSAEAVEA